MHISHQPMAQALLAENLINLTDLEKICENALAFEQNFLISLLNETSLNSKQIQNACRDFYQLPTQAQPESLSIPSFAKPYEALIIEESESKIKIAIADPQYYLDQCAWQLFCEKEPEFYFIDFWDLIQVTNKIRSEEIYNNPESSTELAKQILEDAIHRNASDIHCEPQANSLRIRFRLDGILHTILHAPKKLSAALCSHLKVIANLDIAEKRLPQDGRFQFTTGAGFSKDCRISSCPGLYGEKIVIRVLHAEKQLLQLEQLGLTKSHQAIFLDQIKKPHGLILVTGPTGSGKTVTLYTALNLLNSEEKNISTVEDPIEINLEGIHQVNIQPKAGLDFAKILRSFLRQDPDILMVGEIRDLETAQIAIRAAHTGHLVLATLHTNSAVESITRLINMGIPAYQLSSCLSFVIAQRLVRKKCTRCESGCAYCHKGYKGRSGLFECLVIDETLSEGINQNLTAQQLQKLAVEKGMITLSQDAQKKLSKKITTKSEIQRVLI